MCLEAVALCIQAVTPYAPQALDLDCSSTKARFRRGVACCLLYMAAMCAFYLFVPLARLRPWHLYLWQVGNGFATGGAQTLLGQLGGMYGGAHGGTHNGQHGGVPQRQLWVLRSLYGQTLREQPPAAPPHSTGPRRRKANPHPVY